MGLSKSDFLQAGSDFWAYLNDLPQSVTKPLAALGILTFTTSAYILWRHGINHGDHDYLPDAYLVRGHIPLFMKSSGTGQFTLSLREKTNSREPAYLRTYLSRSLVLFKLKDLKELFQTHGTKSIDRGSRLGLHLEYKQTNAILEISGPVWKNNRRIFHTFVRNWGREKLFQLIMEESKHLNAALAQYQEEFDPTDLLQMAVCNIISTFIFGSRFQYFDRESQKIIHALTTSNARVHLMSYFVWLFFKYVPVYPAFTQRRQSVKENKAFIKRKIQERIRQGVKSPPETLIDAYALESTTTGDKFDFHNLENVIWEIFFAGTETTSTTLAWFLTAIAANPQIQSKMAVEIENTLGDGQLTLNDFNNLPYTLAVQHETQRYGTIAQNTIMHQMNTDVTLSSGKKVRHGEKVLANLYAIMRDPTYFKFPNEFNPENFLNEGGKFQNNEGFVPFGVGPRICLGLNLADMELKVFMIEICRHFKVTSSEQINLSDRVQKLTNLPKPHKFLFVKQNKEETE